MIGCLRKLARFFHPESHRAFILALDHGASEGMLHGLALMPELLKSSQGAEVQGVIMNKGAARSFGSLAPVDTNVAIQLSAGTRHGLPTYNKSVVCSIPEALRLGADAVSIHVNIGNDLEDRMLTDMGMVTDEAHQLGLPVIATVYARGGNIVNEFDPTLTSHSMRVGFELGADVVCVPYSGESEQFGRSVASCPVPVLVTGGPDQPDFSSFLKGLEDALEAGAVGVCVGRNIFQQQDPMAAMEAVSALVHKKEKRAKN